MSAVRVLHVDDEPDIREVVEMSLTLDPEFTVKSVGSGGEALTAVAQWSPDVVLLDVMMPNMDGPTTLRHLREQQTTAQTPVVFMTARAQAREIETFESLGAMGVICKPFDPMTLAASVRGFVHPSEAQLARLTENFRARMRRDAAALASLRSALRGGFAAASTISEIQGLAHGLAGAAGIFGFADVTNGADAVARESKSLQRGGGSAAALERCLDELLVRLAGN